MDYDTLLHTHTHTHIYIYIYIYILFDQKRKGSNRHAQKMMHVLVSASPRLVNLQLFTILPNLSAQQTNTIMQFNCSEKLRLFLSNLHSMNQFVMFF
jgi:hypothetical protein